MFSSENCMNRCGLLYICTEKLFCLFSGNVTDTNATESDSTANITSPVIEEEGPAKVNDVIVTVTGKSVSATSEPISTVTPRAGRIPRAGEDDDQSSGMFGEIVVPTVEEVRVVSPSQLSPDSAETELLLPSNPHQQDVEEAEEGGNEEEDHLPNNDPPWIHGKDTDVFDLDHLFTTTAAPPSVPTNPDIVHVDFFDPSSRGRGLDIAPPSPSSIAHELQGGDATSWAMPENYDYITPYDDGVSPTEEYIYSTTTDAYESDEDLRDPAITPDASRPKVPESGSFIPGASYPGMGAPVPNVPAAAPPAASPKGCQMVNGSCRSACDTQPNYCLNGGQCYQLDSEEIFCR